ncbi:MAG: hypothetical protein COA45_03755 [Zetaproteobacteria bacterium]|nr:MAG: hypothetical protein COA45_03755 [Zetaproteobacteria bacterium]
MSILCFAENPGGANGIIALAMQGENTHIIAEGSAVKYIQDHGIILSDGVPDQVSAIVVGASHSHDSGSFEYILRAKEQGIPSFSYVDACVNTEFRFKGHTDDPLHYAPDFLFVTEMATEKSYINLGFDASRIYIVGNPRYDFVVDRVEGLTKQSAPHKTVLFLADPVVPTIGADYKNSGFNTQSAEDVRSFVLLETLFSKLKNHKIIIKLHPRNHADEFAAYKNNATIYQGDGLGIDLAFQVDMVIGTTTSLLAESALVGVPTIAALLTPQERQWLPHILPDNLIVSTDGNHLGRAIEAIMDDGYARHYPSNKEGLCKKAGVKMLDIIKQHCMIEAR